MQGRFNQYNLTTELAKKHSHMTYLASPTHEPECQVVLTIFSASLFRFPHERENLLQKAQRIQEVQHPHILPILDMGVEEDQPFVVREYLPNGSLRSRLKDLSPDRLNLRDALTIVSQVGDALAYAYEQNILHGNVKPENILFDDDGHAILTDFSLVGKKDAIIRDQASQEYAFCYTAPEQFRGISDTRSDQYALGCLTYELIKGQVPFAAQTLASMMGQPNRALPAPLSEDMDDLPPTLEVAVLKTLAKDPDERFFDFSLFLEVIRSVLSPPPAFPLLRTANSYKNRVISHTIKSVKSENAPTTVHKHTTKRAVSALLKPSIASSSIEDTMREPAIAHANSSISGQTGTALLESISLSEILKEAQAAIPATMQETDRSLFAKEDENELPVMTATSSATNRIASWPIKGIPVGKQRNIQNTLRSYRRLLTGLVVLILVVGASSAYAIFSPFSTIQPDALHQPIQVLKQGEITPHILQQGPDTADTQPTPTGNLSNGQNSGTDDHSGTDDNGASTQLALQSNSIPTELSPSQKPSQISSSSLSPSSKSSSTPASNPSSTPASNSSSSQPSTTTINMTIYFGGWTDNSPPGASIAYPQIHKTAGGTGTYSDPITFAASRNALSPGTIIYVSFLKKYFIMEDDCSDCDSAWNNNHSYKITLWIGGDANSSASAQQSCESSLTPNSPQAVEVRPSSNNAIDTTPLYTNSGGCIKL